MRLKSQIEYINPLPAYLEERQLQVTARERLDIPEGHSGVLVYDTGGSITLLDLAMRQQVSYSGLSLMYEPSLNIPTHQIVFGRSNHIFLIDVTTGMSQRISPPTEGAPQDLSSGRYATFSPDGRYVLYTGFLVYGRKTIRVVDLETSEVFDLILKGV